ncbi:hypothetical protein [Streptomyces sp. NPDC000229]|uniref:hypothetical protein n=1 Tax=Streptomyces sp. NPDC000229 TaxID=3154247 RepID=UPI00332EC368
MGDIFWYALPLPTNMSDQDVEIVAAEVSDVPPGVEVVRYGAHHLDDTEGIPLLTTDTDPHAPKFRELKDYSKGFTVKAKAVSDIVYMAQLRITGKVQKNPTECRYDYRQGGKLYRQSLRCAFELRLKK